MDLNKFTTDLELEEDGKWVPLDNDSRIRVARVGNKRYKQKFTELSAPHVVAIRNKTISDEVADMLLATSLGYTVLVGWEGLTIDGEMVEYSHDKATEILLDPKFKDFREMVVGIATDMDVYKKAQDEALVENS